MYTIEELRAINVSCRQPITEDVLRKANELVEFRRSLDNSVPMVGDVVIYEGIDGKISKHAHIEKVEEGKISLCKHPCIPFTRIDRKKNSLSTSTSGGDWTCIFIEDLEKADMGITEKTFCDFLGLSGASRAVHFNLEVKVWKYKEIRSYKEQLFESVSSIRVKDILEEVRKTTPQNIYEALKILKNSFNWDRCFSFSPISEGETYAHIKLFDRYDLYCSCPEWTIIDKSGKENCSIEVEVLEQKKARTSQEQLLKSVSIKRVEAILEEVRETRPQDIYEALKILKNAYNEDGCFSFSPMFEDEKHAYIKLLDRYEIYCYCPDWNIFDKLSK